MRLGRYSYYHDITFPGRLHALEKRRALKHGSEGGIDVAVIALPHIANFDDFDPWNAKPALAALREATMIWASGLIYGRAPNHRQRLAYLKKPRGSEIPGALRRNAIWVLRRISDVGRAIHDR